MRAPFSIIVPALLISLGSSIYLAELVIRVLGDVPEEMAIRPMGLFGHIFSVSVFAALLNLLLGVTYMCNAPRKMAAYFWGLLTIALGVAPFIVAIWLVKFLIDLRGLVLAD
jgi:hypothetical protein